MRDKRVLISELLLSISGVMLFLSISKIIDLNGWQKYSLIFAFIGIIILFTADKLSKLIPIPFIRKPLLLALSHILVFLGIKNVLSIFIDDFLTIVIIVGIILLSYNQEIARLIIDKK